MNITEFALLEAVAVLIGISSLTASASPPSDPWVRADVRGALPEAFGDWTGDPVQFTVDATGRPGETAGSFSARHVDAHSGDVLGDFTGRLTCLQVGGEVAVATGVITNGHAFLPSTGMTDVTGQKVSFTLHDDGRHDRMAWMWEFLGAPVSDCVRLAPTFRPSAGRIRVRQ